MISKQAVEEQLRRIGCNFRFWGKSEVNELDRILMEDEVIAECVNGEYVSGFAMLLTTNHRLLLVDKKPFLYLTVEDVRYEMITEFNFSHRLLNATLNVHTANKTLTFKSWNQRRLRNLLEYIQARVLEMRQQQHMAQQFQAAAAAQYAQYYAQAQGIQAQLSYIPAQQLSASAAGGLGGSGQVVWPAPASAEQARYVQWQPVHGPASRVSGPGLQHGDYGDPNRRVFRSKGRQLRWTNGRAALGTYTRSKLPNLRRYREHGAAMDVGSLEE